MTAPYRKRAKGGWNTDKDAANNKERRQDAFEIAEQLEETSKVSNTPVTKKKNEHKDTTRFIGRMRWIYKLCQGNVEYLNKPKDGKNDWIRDYNQRYYQEYKKGLPKLIELSKRDDLPNKILRQVNELMVLLGIETSK